MATVIISVDKGEGSVDIFRGEDVFEIFEGEKMVLHAESFVSIDDRLGVQLFYPGDSDDDGNDGEAVEAPAGDVDLSSVANDDVPRRKAA